MEGFKLVAWFIVQLTVAFSFVFLRFEVKFQLIKNEGFLEVTENKLIEFLEDRKTSNIKNKTEIRKWKHLRTAIEKKPIRL